MIPWKVEFDVKWAIAGDTTMASQADKLQAVNIKMFSVNNLENSYNLYLNEKLNYFKGLHKKVHTKLMKIENLWSTRITALGYSTGESFGFSSINFTSQHY